MPEVFADEDFEQSSEGWMYNNGAAAGREASPYFTSFLGRLSRSNNLVKKSFTVPDDTDYVTLDFDFLELDNWERSDHIKVTVGNTVVDLGEFADVDDERYQGGEQTGSGGTITWKRESMDPPANYGFSSYKDQRHKVELMIPSGYFASDNVLSLKFSVVFSLGVTNESAGIDNLKLTSRCNDEPPTEICIDTVTLLSLIHI